MSLLFLYTIFFYNKREYTLNLGQNIVTELKQYVVRFKLLEYITFLLAFSGRIGRSKMVYVSIKVL